VDQISHSTALVKGNDISPSFASFLDLARAFSAIVVFLNHLRVPLFTGYPNLPADQQGIFVQLWFFVTGFGFASVMVFFVLSGFLVGGINLNRANNRTFRPQAYFVDRISRLFVVLLPALALTLVLDQIGMRFFAETGLWDRSNPIIAEKFPESFAAYSGWQYLACNAAMLQSFYCQVYGSNIPLWSLSYEFWFYVCFGAGAIAITTSGIARATSIVAVVLIVAALGLNFLWLAPVWLFGLVAYSYSRDRFRWPVVAIASFLMLACAVRIMSAGPPPGNVPANLVVLAEGAAFAWVLISMRHVNSRWLVKLAPFGSRLASFSYTLYLIHYPVMLIIIALTARLFGLDLMQGFAPASALGIGIYVSIFVLVMIVSWLFAAVTEAHTAKVRYWLRQKIETGWAQNA
jgi:peptidoglycan/LPS O-acetylase OafA/YrhL